MFIIRHYFTFKLFADLHEALSNEYPNKEVLNKRTTPPDNTSQSCMKHIKTGWLSSGRWWTLSASALKLFFKFLLTKLKKTHCFSHYFDDTKAYKYCCCQICILNGTLCIRTLAFRIQSGIAKRVLNL